MKYFKCSINILIVFFVICLVFPQKSYAYLDPGTGSYFFQIFIAILIGGLFSIKVFWHKIKSVFMYLFSRRKGHKKDES